MSQQMRLPRVTTESRCHFFFIPLISPSVFCIFLSLFPIYRPQDMSTHELTLVSEFRAEINRGSLSILMVANYGSDPQVPE